MSMYRRDYNTDANQKDIVKALRKVPGVTVKTGMDDILVGCKGVNYWYEIKVSEKAAKQKAQIDLVDSWAGKYRIVWTVEQILDDLGILRREDTGD